MSKSTHGDILTHLIILRHLWAPMETSPHLSNHTQIFRSTLGYMPTLVKS